MHKRERLDTPGHHQGITPIIADVEAGVTLDVPVDKAHRSRFLNGKEVLPGVDGRYSRPRQIKDLYQGIIEDLGGDGCISTLQRCFALELATMMTMNFAYSALWAEHDTDYNYVEHMILIRTITSTARLLGIKRSMRLINPEADKTTLRDYVQG